jgi:hypothetical protein
LNHTTSPKERESTLKSTRHTGNATELLNIIVAIITALPKKKILLDNSRTKIVLIIIL